MATTCPDDDLAAGNDPARRARRSTSGNEKKQKKRGAGQELRTKPKQTLGDLGRGNDSHWSLNSDAIRDSKRVTKSTSGDS